MLTLTAFDLTNTELSLEFEIKVAQCQGYYPKACREV